MTYGDSYSIWILFTQCWCVFDPFRNIIDFAGTFGNPAAFFATQYQYITRAPFER